MGIKSLIIYSFIGFALSGCGSGLLPGLKVESSQCTANFITGGPALTSKVITRQVSSLAAVDLASVCSNSINYNCNAKIFSPNVSSNSKLEKQCSNLSELGSPCLDVDLHTYGSAHLINSSLADPNGFKPGGEFNHSEYRCYNNNAGIDIAKILGEADTLDGALKAAYNNCSALQPSGALK